MNKTKTKTRKNNKKAQRRGLMLRRAVKLVLVSGLWALIALGTLTAWYAADLPQLIDNPRFERQSAVTLLDRGDNQIARYGELRGLSVSVEEVPAHLVYAVLAVEDRRFYQHFGLDPVGLARAASVNLTKGRVAQGGSTITQQLAKNLFLSHERTFKRKVQEALLALWLERELTKDEILSAYLNRVYLGAGAYGVDAAAQTYFDKPASELTLYESAMLAGLLKAPSRYSPQNNPGQAAQRARVVLAAMESAGYISPGDKDIHSSAIPMPLRKPGIARGERYFGDWVTGELGRLIGTTDMDLMIKTTFDPDIQKAAENALYKLLGENPERKVTQGAIIVMRADGAVLAMVGGANYGVSQFNRAVQARRPPGSAFKPFVFLAALSQGWRSTDRIEDSRIIEGSYQPVNFNNEYHGEVTLSEALAKSMNTATVRLAQQVGIDNIISTMRAAGIQSRMERDLSITLGSPGIGLLELTTAYATFANAGARISPYAINAITDKDGTIMYIRKAPLAKQAFAPRDVQVLSEMMVGVIENGTGRSAKLPFYAAGKTGTSQDHRDAWFVGYSDKLITGVWLGNDDNSPMQGVSGGNLPATLWREVMIAAHEKEQGPKPLIYIATPSAVQQAGSSFSNMIGRLLSFND